MCWASSPFSSYWLPHSSTPLKMKYDICFDQEYLKFRWSFFRPILTSPPFSSSPNKTSSARMVSISRWIVH
jgi:hypothetical protein